MMAMGQKTIVVQDEVYELLSILKGSDRSFNDVIRDLIQHSGDIRPFFGVIDDAKAQEMLDVVMVLKKKGLSP